MRLAPGMMFAGYQIEKLLGAGGMGVVYLARHPRLSKLVALKVLNDSLAGDPGARSRFEREAAVAARLEHVNIVPVLDRNGPDDPHLWLSMPYIEGADAAELLRAGGGLAADRAVRIVEQAARGLDHAHRMGVIHRDVKPANILVMPDPSAGERALVSDFGIARSLTDTQTVSAIAVSFGYSAPERFRGEVSDHRADVYSLGATLYQLLTGELPFPYRDQAAIMLAHLQEPPPSLRERCPGLPSQLSEVIAKALAKDPADRYVSCGELARDAVAAMSGAQPRTVFNSSPPQPIQQRAFQTPVPDGPSAGIGRRRLLIGLALGTPVVATAAVAGMLGSRGDDTAYPSPGPSTSSPASPVNEDDAIAVLNNVNPVTKLAFNSEGILVSGDNQGLLQLWDIQPVAGKRGEPIHALRMDVQCVTFTPDGASVLACAYDGYIQYWDWRTASPNRDVVITGDSGWHTAALSPDGALLATGSSSGELRFWDARSRTPLTEPVLAHESWGHKMVNSLAFSPDGAILASAGLANGEVKLWDTATHRQMGAPLLSDSTDNPLEIAFSPDGAMLASATNDNQVILWDIHSRSRIGNLTMGDATRSVAFSSDGGILAVAGFSPGGSTNPHIWLWDVGQRRLLGKPLSGHTNGVNALAFSPDGNVLASGSADGTIRVWNVREQ